MSIRQKIPCIKNKRKIAQIFTANFRVEHGAGGLHMMVMAECDGDTAAYVFRLAVTVSTW